MVRLLESARQGDATARDELLARDADRLRSLAAKMLRDFPRVERHQEVEDLLQSHWIAMRQALERNLVEDVLHYRRLAVRIMRNLLIDMARRYKHVLGESVAMSPDDSRGDSPAMQIAQSTANPERLASWVAFHESARALPGRLGEVFDLIYYQGLTQVEAARQLGLSERTVRSLFHRARESLANPFNR